MRRPFIKTQSMLETVLVAGVVSLLAHSLPHQLGLIVAALAGAIAGFSIEKLQIKGT